MKKERYIFDLDGTLLTSDYHLERELFSDLFGECSYLLNSKVGEYLEEYERKFPFYEVELLSKFLSDKTGLSITPNIIREWIKITGDDPGVMEDGVIETLDYLKSQDKSIIVLTNWFFDSQMPRLRDSGLLEYIDDIFAGDCFLKPRKEAYLGCRDQFDTEDCIMIGDNLDKDYIGPRACNMESILYDKNGNHHKNVVKVKKISDIIDRY